MFFSGIVGGAAIGRGRTWPLRFCDGDLGDPIAGSEVCPGGAFGTPVVILSVQSDSGQGWQSGGVKSNGHLWPRGCEGAVGPISTSACAFIHWHAGLVGLLSGALTMSDRF